MQRFNVLEFLAWCNMQERLFVFDTNNQQTDLPPGIRLIFKFPVVKISVATKRIQFSNTYDVFLIEQVKEVRYYEDTQEGGGFVDIISGGKSPEDQRLFRFLAE